MLRFLRVFFRSLWCRFRQRRVKADSRITPNITTPPATFAQLAALWLAHKRPSLKPTTNANLRHLCAMLAKALASCSGSSTLASELLRSYKPSTVRQLLNVFDQINAFASAQGIHTLAKCTMSASSLRLYYERHHRPLPSRSQIMRLLAAASGELADFLHIAFYTGARASEILALKKSDIDYSRSIITISRNATRCGLSTPKNGRSRQIFIPKALKTYLKERRFNGFSLGYFQIYYAFSKLCRQLKVQISGLHTMRHAYASYCASANVSLPLIAKMLGHSDISMLTRTYLHSIADAKELRKLNALYTK